MTALEYLQQSFIGINNLPDGAYKIIAFGDEGDEEIFVRVVNGVASEISKAEYESDVPTVDPPY